MAKWKEIPLGKVKNLFMDAQEIPLRKNYTPTREWPMTAEDMNALLDDVFYKVIGFIPVAKYEEDE